MSHATIASRDEIDHRLGYHAPTPERVTVHEQIRAALIEASHKLHDLVPVGRDKALMLTHIEEALYFANAAVARVKD